MYQWRKFEFFEEKYGGKCKVPDKITAEIQCCSSGRGKVAIGCDDRTVSLLDRSLKFNYAFQAHSSSVLFLQQLKKLRVWCRHPNSQWELGRIRSFSGKESFLQLDSGNVISGSTIELLPANPEILQGVDDLIQLSYLNEPSVLYNLQQRYSRNMIYTKAGPVLIAINPFKAVSIYESNFITAYRQKLADSPHVYATTHATYTEIMRGSESAKCLGGQYEMITIYELNHKDGSKADDSSQRRSNQDLCMPELEQQLGYRRRPIMFVTPCPSILVGYQDDWLKTSASSLHVWEKAPLEPYAFQKNMSYYVVCPNIDPLTSAAADFFQQLGTGQ